MIIIIEINNSVQMDVCVYIIKYGLLDNMKWVLLFLICIYDFMLNILLENKKYSFCFDTYLEINK